MPVSVSRDHNWNKLVVFVSSMVILRLLDSTLVIQDNNNGFIKDYLYASS